MVNSWNVGVCSDAKESNQKDFKELNKYAISNKIHTAKVKKAFI